MEVYDKAVEGQWKVGGRPAEGRGRSVEGRGMSVEGWWKVGGRAWKVGGRSVEGRWKHLRRVDGDVVDAGDEAVLVKLLVPHAVAHV